MFGFKPRNYIKTSYTTFDKKPLIAFEQSAINSFGQKSLTPFCQKSSASFGQPALHSFDKNQNVVNQSEDVVCHDMPAHSYSVLSAPLQTDKTTCGLLEYRKWWELREVDICIGGKLISGTPIFVEANALRVISNDCSYFVPLEKIDYIRTKDGLVME